MMPHVGRRGLLAGGAILIAGVVAYTADPRAGAVVLILLLGIIIVA